MSRIWVSLFLLASLAARAETFPSSPPPFSIDEAVAMAVRDNPELAGLRARWEAMQEQPAQARALHNPMFTYGGMDAASGGSWPDTNQKRFMLQQDLPGFGKRGLREGVAVQEAEMMRYDLETATRDVVMNVKNQYVELAAVRQVLLLLQEEEGLLRRMEKVAETQYAPGARTQVDVLAAQAEITRLKQKQLDFQARDNTLQAKLNILLNRGVEDPLKVEASPTGPEFGDEVAPLLELASANRPEIRLAQARIQRDEQEIRLRKKESAPDYRVGLEYRDMGTSDDMAMFTIGVDLPIWRTKERAGIRAAGDRQASSQAALESANQLSALAVQDAHFQWMTAKRTLELTRMELIPQAEARFNASEAGYRTGQVDFMDLLASERALLDAKIMAVQTEGTVGVQAARLERAIGMDAMNGTTDGSPQ